MTAASMISRIAINRGAIVAIIRKDLRALWLFALTLAVLQLVMSALFRTPPDYPDVMVDFGQSQLHVAPAMFLLHMFGLPIVSAIFVVLLVHQDPATDARNDWMVRPVSALDLVAAKALVILAVVLIPSAIGNFAYAALHPLSSNAAIGPIVLTLIGCIFMLVVAWLASSPVQALLAPLVLSVATLVLILSLGLTIGAGVMGAGSTRSVTLRDATVEIPSASARSDLPDAEQAAPQPNVGETQGRTGATQRRTEVQGRRQDGQGAATNARGPRFVPIERPAVERPRVIDLTWPILITEFLLMLAAAGVVLWLLLVRRRLFAARMTFLGFFGGAVLLMLLQGSVSTPRDEMIVFESIAAPAPVRPAPPQAERFAAFAKHDANGDNKLDKTEYAAVLEDLGFSEQFDSLWMQRDDNMDGFVSAEEYRAVIPGAPGGPPAPDVQRFAAFTKNDANKDGKLDKPEYRAVLSDLGFSAQFDTLWMQRDGDGDGFISGEEYGMPR